MGSSDLAVPDFWSLTCGPCIWWDPHISDSMSGKVRIGKLEDPAPRGSMPTLGCCPCSSFSRARPTDVCQTGQPALAEKAAQLFVNLVT
jgi:hypothetical protein